MSDELVLGLATIVTPMVLGMLVWQQRIIAARIRYIEKKLDDCLIREDNRREN